MRSSTPRMQRPDAYTAAGKLTKPVWLLIIGGAGALACSPASPASPSSPSRSLPSPQASISWTCDRRSWRSRESPASAPALRRGSVRGGWCPRARLPSRRRPSPIPRPLRPMSTTSSGRSGATCRVCGCIRRRRRGRAFGSVDMRFVDADEAWAEVLTLSPDADHARDAGPVHLPLGFAELGQPGKTSWNLEPWRTEVSHGHAGGDGCNPGGTEEPF